MIMLNVYRVCKYPLSEIKAVEMLRNPCEDEVLSLPPVQPKPRELFIFKSFQVTGVFHVHQVYFMLTFTLCEGLGTARLA